MLLPNRYTSLTDKVGDRKEVFLYHDSEDRLVATTETPLLREGEAGYLRVVDKTAHGAFLDWGLHGKDLFLPNRNQQGGILAGHSYIVYLYEDNITGRCVATTKLKSFINNDLITVKPREEVSLLVASESEIGFRVIVIGAGAAGMMAAGTAARSGRRVLLIEKMEKSGRKVRITGKGRCNVTNARPAEEFADQVRTNAEFFKVAFSEFNNRAAIKFFERAGVKLDIERGDRVFPQSGKAWDIANALLEFCVENGVKIIYNTRVTEILTLGDRVFGVKYINRRGFERKEECAQVILATGGVSYPATGSTGDGYAFAADLGHTIEPLRPSLTPLLSSHAQMRYLDKVLLRNVRATLYVDNEPVREEFGEIGFSDRGIEGAVALRMSRDAVDALIEEKRVKLVLDLKPALTEEVLHERIAREIAELQPNEFFGELLRKLVPKPLVMPLAQEVDIRANCYVGKITEEQITRLVRTLKGLTFPITDYAPFEYAVVTAGGVRCDEVNPYTMESLKVKGLYFAGEVLDIDANTGGYNLQIAFSTGRLAGSLKK